MLPILLAAVAASAAPTAEAASSSPPTPSAVNDVFRRAEQPPPARDPALDRAARAAAEAGPDASLRPLLRDRGVHAGLMLPLVVVAPEEGRGSERWRRYVRRRVLPRRMTHYGFGRHGEARALVFVRRVLRDVELEGRPAAGGRLRLRGRLASGYAGTEAYLARPDERVDRLDVRQLGRDVSVRVPLVHGEGRYRLEVMAHGDRGSEVAALIPLPVGEVEAKARASPPPAGSPEAGESPRRRLLERIDRARRRRDLEPLRSDAALQRTAQAHAEAMARAGTAAHRLDDGRGPSARLAGAGLHPGRFHENVAAAGSAARVHAILWRSPSHRLALLDPEIDRVGIGVEEVSTEAGRVLYVVQHLADR